MTETKGAGELKLVGVDAEKVGQVCVRPLTLCEGAVLLLRRTDLKSVRCNLSAGLGGIGISWNSWVERLKDDTEAAWVVDKFQTCPTITCSWHPCRRRC